MKNTLLVILGLASLGLIGGGMWRQHMSGQERLAAEIRAAAFAEKLRDDEAAFDARLRAQDEERHRAAVRAELDRQKQEREAREDLQLTRQRAQRLAEIEGAVRKSEAELRKPREP